MFSKSRPWGYHPKEVESKIDEYKETLGKLNDKYAAEKQIVLNLDARVERLESELRQRHLEMSALELPNADEVVGSLVLNDFKNYNSKSQDKDEPKDNNSKPRFKIETDNREENSGSRDNSSSGSSSFKIVK